MKLSILNQTLHLHPYKAVFWGEKKILFLSDLHLGKSYVFQKFGIPISAKVQASDLQRLSRLINQFCPKTVLVLGDFLHQSRIDESLLEDFALWRAEHANVELKVIRGNHEKRLKAFPAKWSVELIEDRYQLDPFTFEHEDGEEQEGTDQFSWFGHLHPMVQLERRRSDLRFQCFFLKKTKAYLPAFCEFSRGCTINALPEDTVVAVSEETLFAVKTTKNPCGSF